MWKQMLWKQTGRFRGRELTDDPAIPLRGTHPAEPGEGVDQIVVHVFMAA